MSNDHNTSAFIFDCDGVVLDSNEIKSQVFWEIANELAGNAIADKFIEYHQRYGGISRQKKFEYFFSEVWPASDGYDRYVADSVKKFGEKVFEKLLVCPTISGVESFLSSQPGDKFIVSGGDQKELREVFRQRGLDKYFVSIHGNPETKPEILQKYIRMEPGKRFVFFGDSRADYEAASLFNMDFIFVSGRSEFVDWRKYFQDKKIEVVTDFTDPKLTKFLGS